MSESPELVLSVGTPIRRQIELQIRKLVRSGALQPGEELPTVRAVAVGLGVSPHAVQEAYEELGRSGFLTCGDTGGPCVAALNYGSGNLELKQMCKGFLEQTAQSGFSPIAVLETIQSCLEEERRS